LSQRLLSLGGIEGDFGFECGVMLSAHSDHFTIPPLGLWQVKMHLIALSEIWGEAHFANFNRGITGASRFEILRVLKSKMRLISPIPSDFDGVPIVSLQKAWFFPYRFKRIENSISILWELAKQVVEGLPEGLSSEVFEGCLAIEQVGFAKLTMGMFWMQPDRYLAFDQLNIAYLSEHGLGNKILKVRKLESYLNVLKEIRKAVGSDFAWISHKAYVSTAQLKLEFGELDKGFRKLLQRTSEKNNCSVSDLTHSLKEVPTFEGENEISNRVNNLKKLSVLLHSKEFSIESLRAIIDKLWVLGGQQDIMRRNAFLKSAEALPNIKALLDDESEIPISVRVKNFIDASFDLGYRPNEGEDRTCPAQFASAILSAYYPDKFVDFRTGRWNQLYKDIFETNQIILHGRDYGYLLIRAGSFAAELIKTNTYKEFFGNENNLWTIAGLAYLFKDGPFVYEGKSITEKPPGEDSEPEPPETISELPKATNLILYGPPGTGKTYKTIRYAVELIDGEASSDDLEVKSRFDKLMEQSRIAFVTFHQSYSYEDFVEGIRPVIESEESTSGARYECRDGVFKKLCAAARAEKKAFGAGAEIDLEKVGIWKMSLGDTQNPDDAHIFADCIRDKYIAHGAGRGKDFSNGESKEKIKAILDKENWQNWPSSLTHNISQIHALRNEVQIGDIVIVSDGNHKFRAVGRVIGNYYFDSEYVYPQKRPVEWLRVFEESQPKERILKNKAFSQLTLYSLDPQDLKIEALRDILTIKSGLTTTNYVLIIDEINRGNISKILGELITLIEPDKREGQPYQLTVILPYSQETFSVPNNLHIIGTMNSADKSIALVDVALRRRFEFKELMPDFKNLCPNMSEEMYKVLIEMNRRIAIRKDRDHQIGHAYFMEVSERDSFNRVFKRTVLPLLQEYFYNDWDGIRYVLGEEDETKGKFIGPIYASGHKWARNRWQWYSDDGSPDLDFLSVLVNNYKLSVGSGGRD